MVGLIQLVIWILCFYLVVKGFELVLIAHASDRDDRAGVIIFGMVMLVVCVIGALSFFAMQVELAE